MPGFILDTSGTVHAVPGAPAGQGTHHPVDLDWCDLDAFTQGYVIALFNGWSLAPQTRSDGAWDWMLTDLNEHEWWCGEKPATAPNFRPARFSDLAPETLARIMKECREFLAAAPSALGAHFPQRPLWPEGDEKYPRAGRDFWLTRNGHGSGFWDGSWPEPYASKLDQLAKAAGVAEVYLGDDGRVYLS